MRYEIYVARCESKYQETEPGAAVCPMGEKLCCDNREPVGHDHHIYCITYCRVISGVGGGVRP